MVGGYAGKVLRVNLTSGECREEPLDMAIARRFIGGRGLGGKFLFDEVGPEVEPLSPENKLIYATGPATGTLVPGSGRYAILTKSTETGLFLDCYGGGHFPAEMKFAGLDFIIIEGKAERPSYLFIRDGQTEIRDASHLWGMKAYEAETRLKQEVGDEAARVSLIGPAGERLSNLALVQNDYYHHCARGGLGAVMGSKNLKAVVVRGTRGVPIADLKRLSSYLLNEVEKKMGGGGVLGAVADRTEYGTPLTLNITQKVGILPTRNFKEGQFEGAREIDAYAFRRKIAVSDKSCFGCSLTCTKFSRAKVGPYAGEFVGGTEYETNGIMGANLDNASMEAVLHLNLICDDLGLDTIGAGVLVGFAMECYERGILSKADLGGLDLRFGNIEAANRLIHMIAYREGIGDLLSQGVKKASQEIGKGSEEFAMHCKGMEYPAYRPGVNSLAFALGFAITERGACHRRCWPAIVEQNLKPFVTDGRAKLVKDLYDQRIPWHCGVLCDIAVLTPGLDFVDAANLFSAVTGWELTAEELAGGALGDTVAALARSYNVREGATRADDILAPRSFGVEVSKPGAGHEFTREMLEEMLDEYYALRGWSREGVPERETLVRLGLGDVAEELSRRGKLPEEG